MSENTLINNEIADVTITIKGMGLTISTEVNLITDFLKSKGYKVEIDDEYPSNRETDRIIPKKIKIITEHLPWGG